MAEHTYFRDPITALAEAHRRQMVKTDDGRLLPQMCYHHGPPVPAPLLTLVSVPLTDLNNFFATNTLPLPTRLVPDDFISKKTFIELINDINKIRQNPPAYFIDFNLAMAETNDHPPLLPPPLCYYGGVKMDHAPPNLTHVPFSQFTHYFSNNTFPLPSRFVLTPGLPDDKVREMEEIFSLTILEIKKMRQFEQAKQQMVTTTPSIQCPPITPDHLDWINTLLHAEREWGSPARGANVTLDHSFKVLLIIDRWHYCRQDMPENNNMHNLLGSLERCNIGQVQPFFSDQPHLVTQQDYAVALIKAIAQWQPTLLVFHVGLVETRPTPPLEMLEAIRYHWRLPMIFIWFDLALNVVYEFAALYRGVADAAIALDIPQTITNTPTLRQHFLPMWIPQDPKIFHDRKISRDIDVAFLGSRNHYENRYTLLEKLNAMDIRTYIGGGLKENFLELEAYGTLLCRSKIVLNFAKAVNTGIYQSKGRVFEILCCNALLLEEKNQETAFWLRDGIDYVSFADGEDLTEKIAYYLAHEEERQQIAASGHQRALSEYSADAFWRKIFQVALDHHRQVFSG